MFVIYCPLCYIAFGNNIQYMVLMNLGQGLTTEPAKIIYAIIVSTFNLAINFYPIFDIMESKVNELKTQNDLNIFERILAVTGANKYILRIISIFLFLPICPYLDGISLFVMLNGFFCVNFFQLILPNYIVLC
jgi:hypothetical protein